MAHGAYHFMTWCRTAAEQAAWFAKMVPADPSALPPVLDLEWNNHSSCKNKFSREDVLEKVRVMLAAMEAHTGKVPVIYTDMTFHRDILEGERFDNAFWLRSTAAEPHQRYKGRGWTFWQWTQTGTMRGIRGEVDRNAFYGNRDEWTTFILTGCDPRLIATLGPQGRCSAK
jgi:lysozyme